MSGITVDDACVQAFQSMKTKRTARYIVFTIEKDEKVVVKTIGDREKTYADFLQAIGKEPCYAVFDVEFNHTDGGSRARMALITYIPSSVKVRARMVYASTKDAVKTAIGEGLVDVQAMDDEEISEENVVGKVKHSMKA